MDCDVIVPAGPGHQEIYQQAMESVRIASLDKGPFEKVNIQLIDDSRGELGRGKARNQGIDRSDADWIFLVSPVLTSYTGRSPIA